MEVVMIGGAEVDVSLYDTFRRLTGDPLVAPEVMQLNERDRALYFVCSLKLHCTPPLVTKNKLLVPLDQALREIVYALTSEDLGRIRAELVGGVTTGWIYGNGLHGVTRKVDDVTKLLVAILLWNEGEQLSFGGAKYCKINPR